MKKNLIVVLILCGLILGYAEPRRKKATISGKQRREAIKKLNQHHKFWFDMITYISTREERDVFLKLSNDRDKDMFVKAFWLQRDPTPGTPSNEYKLEIEKRFSEANKQFGRTSGRPGWMTDRGKFYMILGKPNSIDRFDSKAGLYPARVWFYYGDKNLGLPTYFNITFFQPKGTTEWKLYNPATDGPDKLMILHEPVDREDYSSLYMKIYQVAPILAQASISMLPGEALGNYNFAISLRSNLILSNIYDAPKRRINVSYATNFLNYKGFVNVDASINYIENTHLASVSRYERFGFNFVNISVKPKQISLGYSEEREKYYFNLELSVSLKKGEDFIHQYSKNFDFYIDEDNIKSLKGNGVVLHDSFPVLPGKYKLMVFVKNTVGKEFTYFDMDIESKPQGSMALLATPVLGYKLEDRADNFFSPYRLQNSKLFVDTDKTFRVKEKPYVWLGVYNLNKELWQSGKLEIHLRGLNERVKFSQKYQIKLSDYKYNRNLNVFYRLSENGLSPDYYEFEIRLLDKLGILIDKQGSNFSVSPLKSVGYPMETFKRSRLDNPYMMYFIMGNQYENIGNYTQAEKFYDQCVNNRPDFGKGHVALLTVLNRTKKYTKVMVEVEKIKNIKELKFEYYLIKGTALYGMKDFNAALDELLKANEMYNSDIRVLNLLGFTLANLKNYPEAIKALEASLNLDKQQPFIQKAHKELKQKLDVSPNEQQ